MAAPTHGLVYDDVRHLSRLRMSVTGGQVELLAASTPTPLSAVVVSRVTENGGRVRREPGGRSARRPRRGTAGPPPLARREPGGGADAAELAREARDRAPRAGGRGRLRPRVRRQERHRQRETARPRAAPQDGGRCAHPSTRRTAPSSSWSRRRTSPTRPPEQRAGVCASAAATSSPSPSRCSRCRPAYPQTSSAPRGWPAAWRSGTWPRGARRSRRSSPSTRGCPPRSTRRWPTWPPCASSTGSTPNGRWWPPVRRGS